MQLGQNGCIDAQMVMTHGPYRTWGPMKQYEGCFSFDLAHSSDAAGMLAILQFATKGQLPPNSCPMELQDVTPNALYAQ